MASLQNLISSVEYRLGDIVYLNIAEGFEGIIFAYVVYPTHVEYLVRTDDGNHQLPEICLAPNKRII